MDCPHCKQPIEILDVEIDFYSQLIKSGSRALRVSPQQLEIFEHLVDAHPGAIPVNPIYDSLYADRDGDDLPEPHSVYVQLRRLATNLEKANFPLAVASMRVDGETRFALIPRQKETAAA